MNEVEEILIQDAQKSLIKIVETLKGHNNLDEIFAAWLLTDTNLGFEFESIGRESARRIGAFRSYVDVAILGFSADAGLIEPEVIKALKEGLEWQSGRSVTINGISTGVSQDSIALLGIALGTRIAADSDLTDLVSKWFSSFINDAYEMRGIENWQKCLIAAAGELLQISPSFVIPKDYSINDVLIALNTKKIFLPNEGLSYDTGALHYLKSAKATEVEATRAALSIAAYNAIATRNENESKLIKQDIMKTTEKIKILFLAASPSNEVHLHLDVEFREIGERLQKAKFRDSFDMVSKWAVRASDLSSYLMEHKPNIVHFSGHGSNAHELILLNKNGEAHPISAEKLGDLFSVLKENIRCVILNACYSEGQAKAIAKHIDCVVGMSDAIGDDSAIVFAEHFYQALAYGKSVQDAFKLGCLQIDMENLDEGSTPKLICHAKNAKDIFFA